MGKSDHHHRLVAYSCLRSRKFKSNSHYQGVKKRGNSRLTRSCPRRFATHYSCDGPAFKTAW